MSQATIQVFLCTTILRRQPIGIGYRVLRWNKGWLAAVLGFLLQDFGRVYTALLKKLFSTSYFFCMLPSNVASHLCCYFGAFAFFSGPRRSRRSQFYARISSKSSVTLRQLPCIRASLTVLTNWHIWHRCRWRCQHWPLFWKRYRRVSSACPPGGPSAVALFYARAVDIVHVDPSGVSGLAQRLSKMWLLRHHDQSILCRVILCFVFLIP